MKWGFKGMGCHTCWWMEAGKVSVHPDALNSSSYMSHTRVLPTRASDSPHPKVFSCWVLQLLFLLGANLWKQNPLTVAAADIPAFIRGKREEWNSISEELLHHTSGENHKEKQDTFICTLAIYINVWQVSQSLIIPM